MKIIGYDEIKKNISFKDLFEPVRQAFIDFSTGKLIAAPVNLLHFEDMSDVHIKMAALKDYPYFSIKVVSMFHRNREKNISIHGGTIFLFSAETGHLTAILKDEGLITDLRTATAGAIITDKVANQSADSVSIIGTGTQAFNQIVALKELRNLERIVIYGRNTDNAVVLKKNFQEHLFESKIKIAQTLEEAVKESQIIITTTSSTQPLVKAEWLSDQHITAVGADDTFKKEIEDRCFEKADRIFVDSLDLNKKYGEYSHVYLQNNKIEEKTKEFGHFFSEVGQDNRKQGLTIAKLVGLGVQDLAASIVVMDIYTTLIKNKQ